jgi:hypothetical protein
MAQTQSTCIQRSAADGAFMASSCQVSINSAMHRVCPPRPRPRPRPAPLRQPPPPPRACWLGRRDEEMMVTSPHLTIGGQGGATGCESRPVSEQRPGQRFLLTVDR